MRTTHMVENYCWSCGALIDGASDPEGDATPKNGDISICFECGSLGIFQADLTTRQPTLVEVERLMQDPQIRDYMLAIRERRMPHPEPPVSAVFLIIVPDEENPDSV